MEKIDQEREAAALKTANASLTGGDQNEKENKVDIKDKKLGKGIKKNEASKS